MRRGEYEVEVQAFMARGQGGRQEKGGGTKSQEKERRRSRSSTVLHPGTTVSRKGSTTETNETKTSSGGAVAEICARKLDDPNWNAGRKKSTRSIWVGHARPS